MYCTFNLFRRAPTGGAADVDEFTSTPVIKHNVFHKIGHFILALETSQHNRVVKENGHSI